jgi:hypothetical protein
MKRHKKAQVGMIGAIILFLFFLVMMFVWLGSWINTAGQIAVQEGSYTGIEAFFYSNFAFFVILCMMLAMLGYMYFRV